MAILAAHDAEPTRWDLTALKRMVVGGSAVPSAMIDGFDRHGLTILSCLGHDRDQPLGSVCRLPRALADAPQGERRAFHTRHGVPPPLVEIRAVDRAGAEIEWDDHTMGELHVRGPWVAAGYHRG